MEIKDLKKGQLFYSNQRISYDYRYSQNNLYILDKIVKKGRGYQIHIIIENVKSSISIFKTPFILSFTDFKRFLSPIENKNVRACLEHCCARHGCKYGDVNCPVENNYIIQKYDCENCDYDKQDAINKLKEIGFEEIRKSGTHEKMLIWRKYNFLVYRKDVYNAIDILLSVLEEKMCSCHYSKKGIEK